jgi:DNA-binding transcriptional regulator YiaG
MRMTQAQFASAFGFPITHLRDWEQGRARPDTSITYSSSLASQGRSSARYGRRGKADRNAR